MFFAIAAIPGAIVGLCMAMLGYSVVTWQFWAALIPVAIAAAVVNAKTRSR